MLHGVSGMMTITKDIALVRPVDALKRIANAIADLTDLPDLLQTTLDETLAVLGMDGGSLCMLEEDDTLSLVAHQSISEATIHDLTSSKISVGECLCGNVAHSLEPLILWNESLVSQYETKESQRDENFSFHAAFPIVIQDRCLGILCVFSRGKDKPSKEQLDLIEIICALAATSIENTRLLNLTIENDRLVRQVYIDALYAVTGGKLIIQEQSEFREQASAVDTQSFCLECGQDLGVGRQVLRDYMTRHFPDELSGDIIVAACEAMTNALKHGDGGTTEIFSDDHNVWIHVQDHGPGIDFAELPKATLMRGYSSKMSLGIGFTVMLDYAEKIYMSTSRAGTDITLAFPVGSRVAA